MLTGGIACNQGFGVLIHGEAARPSLLPPAHACMHSHRHVDADAFRERSERIKAAHDLQVLMNMAKKMEADRARGKKPYTRKPARNEPADEL